MGNRTILTFGLAALLLAAGRASAAENGCLACHGSEDMSERGHRPAILYTDDLHAKAGMTCADCHGGDPKATDLKAAHSRTTAGFRGKADELDVAALCGECHGDAAKLKAFGAERLPTDVPALFAGSVHGKIAPVKGLERPSCSSCHGAHGIRARADAMSPVNPLKLPDTCARCHQDLAYMRAFTSARVRVDQLIEYKTSVHGKRLAEGDANVAVCSSCHGSHEILPATDPRSRVHPLKVAETCGGCHSDAKRMESYRIPAPGGGERPIPTDQQAKYRESVHSAAMVERGDLSAPTCNDCHGNHGATPPEVRAVATVCSQCHSRPAELFAPSALKAELDRLGYPQCATCHGQHAIHRPDDGLLASIAAGETTSGWKPEGVFRETATSFLASIRDLEGRVTRAADRVTRAERFGMDLTRAHLKVGQAQERVVQARVAIHAFDPAMMKGIMEGTEDEPGGFELAASASALADEALGERAYRRRGLAVSLVIIAAVIGLLLAKIRRMEARERASG